MVTANLKRVKFLAFTTKKQKAFLEDLASLLEDGIPTVQAIEYLADVNEGLSVEVANTILIKLAEGHYLAEGLQGWFADHVVEIIRAGEEGGMLATTIRAAAETLTHKQTTMTTLLNALSYLVVVICLGFMASVFINHSIFENFRVIVPSSEWPGIGRDIAAFANFMEQWWWVLFISLCIFVFTVGRVLNNYVGEARHFIDTIPVLALYRQLTAARFMQTLGLLIANGIVLKRALHILQSRANPYLAWHLLTMEYRLGGGRDNITEILDTGLIDRNDLKRLRIVADGKGFEHALLRQGQQALSQSTKTIESAGRITRGIILSGTAGLAIFLVSGVYMVGTSIGAY